MQISNFKFQVRHMMRTVNRPDANGKHIEQLSSLQPAEECDDADDTERVER